MTARSTILESTDLDLGPGLDDASRRRADAKKLTVLRVEWGPEVMRFAVIRDSKKALVGRDPETCDLVLTDTSVSREHAVLRHLLPDRLMLEDVGSTNGTTVNGTTLTGPRPVNVGDQILVGNVPVAIERLSLDEIAHLSELVARLEDSQVDPTSGLMTRRYVDKLLPRQLKTFCQAKLPCAIVVVGIEGLQPLVAEHGHKLGDAAIRVIGRLTRGAVRAQDKAMRLSVDEVALVLPNCEEAAAVSIAERLSTRISKHDWSATLWPTGRPEGAPEGVTVRCGVAQFDLKESSKRWMDRARRALHVARQIDAGVVAASQVP